MGTVRLNRGEIRWYVFRPPDKRRPVLVLTRKEVGTLNDIIVAPATRTIRGLETEIVLTEDDEMPAQCALNFDHMTLVQKDRFGSVICILPENRWPEVRQAVLTACGFGVAERGLARGFFL